MENTKVKNRRVVLASQSPRRQELLKFLFEDFEVRVSDADESLPDATPPAKAVETLALRKARAVAADCPGALVIGSDTVVAIDGLILGKPDDPEEAAAMLRRLSGRVHEVYTGAALCLGGRETVFHVCTGVEFCPLSDAEIAWYLSTGEPFDKAGSYGIQWYGGRYIKGVRGDYFTVMELPVKRLYAEIGEFAKEYLTEK